jgi:transcriptional regulator with XRE-family HTH domain
MDHSTARLAAAIGGRVRHERQARRWTLDQLADVAGVSRRMLVNVEHGVANPSVGTLLRLSDALGVGLPALVEPPESSPLKVTRQGEGATLWTGEHGGSGVLVAGTRAPDVVELWEWTLGPGDVHASEPHAAGTRELIQVLDGGMTVTVGDREAALSVGDAIGFAGDLAHAYLNPGPTSARFTLAVFEPGVGAVARSLDPDRPAASSPEGAPDA